MYQYNLFSIEPSWFWTLTLNIYPNPDPKPNVDSASIDVKLVSRDLQVNKVTHVGGTLCRHGDRVMIGRLKRVSGEVRVSVRDMV